jgi:mono/diheme cytochrome c family protein
MRNRAMRVRAAVVSSVLVSLWSACNSLDEPGVKGDSKLVIPVDERPVAQALTSPPAISGGTLSVSPDGLIAVAADPDRDRVSIVDLQTQQVRHIALEQGDEPGRVVVESAARAYVALRGSGAVLTLNLVDAQAIARTHVCAAPRGMALSVLPAPALVANPGLAAQPPAAAALSGDQLHVACAEGRLVTISTRDQSILRELKFDADLRDVMTSVNGLRVSTFKTTELLSLDNDGNVLSRTEAPEFTVPVAETQNPEAFTTRDRALQPHLAWRSVQAPDGSVMMLHQASAKEEIDIKKRSDEPTEQSSPYGGGGSGLGCQGVVLATVSQFGSQGPEHSLALDGTVLDVDMAISPDGSELAIVEAGTADEKAPRPRIVTADANGEESFATGPGVAVSSITDEFPSESRVIRMPLAGRTLDAANALNVSPIAGCSPGGNSVAVPGQATAVAYAKDGSMLVQSREPALLTRINFVGGAAVINLGGQSVRDTGHDLFHRNSGGGIACASCHAEGAEDGHIWNFKGQGVRRTQALHVGLQGTAPFHWAGDESDLGDLMEDVFVGRMGGVHQSDTRVSSLSRFLFALRAPQPALHADDSAAVRGKALFESTAGCSGCHTGAKFSDNKSYDVGTSQGEHLQVPSLRAVAYRAPFLHTGCAKTLRDRFAPECGGTKHGNVAALQPAQIDDLVAYLQTL